MAPEGRPRRVHREREEHRGYPVNPETPVQGEFVANTTFANDEDGDAPSLIEAGGVYHRRPYINYARVCGEAFRALRAGEHVAECPRCGQRLAETKARPKNTATCTSTGTRTSRRSVRKHSLEDQMAKTATKRKTARVRRDRGHEVGERLWAALWIHGANGVRKGNKVFQVVTLDGEPIRITRGDIVPKMAIRPMRDHDFVDMKTAIKAVEELLETLRIDSSYDTGTGFHDQVPATDVGTGGSEPRTRGRTGRGLAHRKFKLESRRGSFPPSRPTKDLPSR
jgi:hypothetical protein